MIINKQKQQQELPQLKINLFTHYIWNFRYLFRQQKLQLVKRNYSMTDLNLPTLSLFNRSSSRPKKQGSALSFKDDPSIFDILKQSNRIQNQAYIPYYAAAPSLYEQQYRQVRNAMQLDYLNTYYDVVQQRPISQPSYNSTHRAQSFKSFGGNEKLVHLSPQYRENHGSLAQPPLVKFAYLSNPPSNVRPSPPPRAASNQLNFSKEIPKLNKTAYLQARKPQPPQNTSIHPQRSIIHNLHTQKSNPNLQGEDISKFVNQSKNINNNKSVLIDQHPRPQRQLKMVQVQTEDLGANKNSFVINTSVKQSQVMNKKNFQKTMKDLTLKLNNLKLQLDSQDFAIDLSDLILTKDQYIDESKGILNKLNVIAQGRSVSMNDRMTGSLVWPEGI